MTSLTSLSRFKNPIKIAARFMLVSYRSGRQMRNSWKRDFLYPQTRKNCKTKSVLKNVSWHVPSVLLCILLVMTILIYVIRHCHFELLTSWILFACSSVLVFKHAHCWIRPCWNDGSVICTRPYFISCYVFLHFKQIESLLWACLHLTALEVFEVV